MANVFVHCFLQNYTSNFSEHERTNKRSNYAFLITFTLTLLLLLVRKIQEGKITKDVPICLLKFLVSIVVSSIAWPLLFVIILTFATYRQMITFILKAKFKTKFGGLLQGPDSVWAIEDASKSNINILMIVRHDGGPEEFYSLVRKTIVQHFSNNEERLPKLLATFSKSYGYYYMLKNEVTLDECIKKLQRVGENGQLSKKELMELLSEYANKPMPKNHTAFWEVLVGKQPVNWSSNISPFRSYPVIFRIHHSLADGGSLLRILMDMFAESTENRNSSRTYKILRKHHLSQTIKLEPILKKLKLAVILLKRHWQALRIMFLAPFVILLKAGRSDDKNVLHGKTLSGIKLLALKTEESAFYVNAVKRIKNLNNAAAFSDVLITSISRSLNQYFKRIDKDSSSEFVTTVIPAFRTRHTTGYDESPLVLRNDFSLAMFDLPVCFGSDDALPSLSEMASRTRALRSSNDYQINYWLLNVVSSLLPEPLLRPLIESSESTLIISNLPGPPCIAVFGGCPLQDMAFWVPHRGSTGIRFSILSYGGRLQMGLNVDKALISNRRDIQAILEGVCENLVAMDPANETNI